MKKAFTLRLDTDYSQMTYWLYRSTEQNDYNSRPVVDGVYIWRRELGEEPPQNIKLSLEWAQNSETEKSPT